MRRTIGHSAERADEKKLPPTFGKYKNGEPRGGLGREFEVFWTGQTISVVGGELAAFVLPVIAAVALGASALEMGLLVAATQVPNVVAGAFVGPLADALPKKKLLIILDIVRLLALLSIPVVNLLGGLTFAHLVVVGLLLGLANVSFEVTYTAFVPDLVAEDKLIRANGRVGASVSTAQVAGPMVAGPLIAATSGPQALLVTGLTYGISVLTLIALRQKGNPSTGGSGGQNGRAYWKQIGAGLKAVWSIVPIRTIALSSGAFNFFTGASAAILIVFLLRDIGLTTRELGLVTGIGALGGVFGAMATRWVAARIGDAGTLPAGLALGGIGELIVALAPQHHALSSAVAILGTFVATFGVMLFVVSNITIRQRVIPRHQIGSVYGSMRVISRGALPVGAVLGGLLAEGVGYQGAILAAAIGELLVAALCFSARGQFLTSPPSPVKSTPES